MSNKLRDKKLRDKRFYKKQQRKIYRDYNLKHFRARLEYFEATFSKTKIHYLEMPAPKVFSLLDNRSETIVYFNKVDALLRHGTRTHMDFSEIGYTDMPTICTLSAYMVDTRTPSTHLQVSIPKPNRPQFKIWSEAQFENTILRDRELNYGSGGFLSRSGHEINTELIRDILNSTVDFFGSDKKQALNDLSAVINEIVENTTLHADAQGSVGNLRWLINTRTQSDGRSKVKEYCLIDLGVGVYDSIKSNVIRWNTSRSKIAHRLSSIMDEGQMQNVFLSRHIPKGVGSRTNQITRGKGIKHIYETVQNPIYQRFDIITNKAHVHLKDLGAVNNDSTESFFGTIYYWKIGFNE